MKREVIPRLFGAGLCALVGRVMDTFFYKGSKSSLVSFRISDIRHNMGGARDDKKLFGAAAGVVQFVGHGCWNKIVGVPVNKENGNTGMTDAIHRTDIFQAISANGPAYYTYIYLS